MSWRHGKAMKTIIAGGRRVTDFLLIHNAVKASGFDISEVVEGGQRTTDENGKVVGGADYWGKMWADINGIPVKPFPADWKKHGKAAGPIRNRQMAEYAEALIAVWDGVSRGTKNMIEEAEKRELKVYVHRY